MMTVDNVAAAERLCCLAISTLHVVDPSTGTRLIKHECLKSICIQLRQILNNKLNGVSPSLLCNVIDSGHVSSRLHNVLSSTCSAKQQRSAAHHGSAWGMPLLSMAHVCSLQLSVSGLCSIHSTRSPTLLEIAASIAAADHQHCLQLRLHISLAWHSFCVSNSKIAQGSCGKRCLFCGVCRSCTLESGLHHGGYWQDRVLTIQGIIQQRHQCQ